MLTVTIHFPIPPRHHNAFRHAWQAARDTLAHTIGLCAHDFVEPCDRPDVFTLLLTWDDPASFERFARTWIGVWMLSGMGLAQGAFSRPIETQVGRTKPASRMDKHAA